MSSSSSSSSSVVVVVVAVAAAAAAAAVVVVAVVAVVAVVVVVVVVAVFRRRTNWPEKDCSENIGQWPHCRSAPRKVVLTANVYRLLLNPRATVYRWSHHAGCVCRLGAKESYAKEGTVPRRV